ncbi:hypothetical protein LZ32DRAFT_593996 [Colletotrichum eremochloae]|nr:hypothetical protein LZ32DRAFT_593996 [Colletotrichum eremochloae]
MNNSENGFQTEPDVPREHAAVSDVPPSPEALAEAAELQVLGRDGKPHLFKSLYGGLDSTSRVVIVFIRHFYCGACQAYTESVSTTMTPEILSSSHMPTTFVFIGCGGHELIDDYAQVTNCRYPIYTDPTGKLFDTLGMVRTMAAGGRTVYSPKRWLSHAIKGMYDLLVDLPSGKAMKSGDPMQVGGEFVFEECKGEKIVTWCHRMRNQRDHTEVADLCRVLGLDM